MKAVSARSKTEPPIAVTPLKSEQDVKSSVSNVGLQDHINSQPPPSSQQRRAGESAKQIEKDAQNSVRLLAKFGCPELELTNLLNQKLVNPYFPKKTQTAVLTERFYFVVGGRA